MLINININSKETLSQGVLWNNWLGFYTVIAHIIKKNKNLME